MRTPGYPVTAASVGPSYSILRTGPSPRSNDQKAIERSRSPTVKHTWLSSRGFTSPTSLRAVGRAATALPVDSSGPGPGKEVSARNLSDDGRTGRKAVEVVDDEASAPLHGFVDDPGGVGGRHDARVPGHGRRAAEALGLEHVEACRPDPTLLEGGEQRRLLDQRAPGHVDDDRLWTEKRDRLGVEDVVGFPGEREVQRDDVGARQRFVQLRRAPDRNDAELAELLGGGRDDVDATYLHPEGRGSPSELTATGADTDQQKATAGELVGPRVVEGAGIEVRSLLVQLACARQDQEHGVLAERDGAATARGVGDGDAVLLQVRQVEMVEAVSE